MSTYSATIGTATLLDGATDEYTVPWTGPWTVPDGGGGQQPLPSGNYRLVIRGRPAGATEDLASEPYEKVSLVEVVGIEVQSFNGSVVEPDPRPGAPANAVRIFTEAQEPASTSNPIPEVYDTVRLVARISPAVDIRAGQNPVKVFFRALDVDDPSARAKPVDDEGVTADNRDDPKAGVFRLEMWTPPGAAADGPIGGVVDKEAASGAVEAAVVVRVSPRQGDNYRFVASTLRSWVEAPAVKQGPVAPGATPSWLDDAQARPLDTALEGTQVSPLLTVWAAQLPATDRGYVLQDDHIGSLAALSADYGLAIPLLEQAFIRLVPHLAAVQSADIPFVMSASSTFKQGLPLDRRNIREDALYSLPSEGRSTASYWSIQLVSAFEGDPAADMDPQSEGTFNLGVAHIGSCSDGTIMRGGCKPHAALFLEVVRDLTNRPQGFSNLPPLAEVVRRATAHEIFHGLNLEHGKAIMCAGRMLDAGRSDGGQLVDDHIHRLRSLSEPVMSVSPQSQCR